MSDHKIFFGGGATRTDLTQQTEFQDYDNNYFLLRLQGGYDRTYWDPTDIPAVLAGSLRLQAGFNYLGGDEGNLGSHSRAFDLGAGWKQRFYIPWIMDRDGPVQLFLNPGAGLGVARNRFNFGRGFPLEAEHSLNLHARLGIGAEYCFTTNSCAGLVIAPFYESSVAGLGYSHHGVLIGPELETDLFGPKKKKCPHQKKCPPSDPCWEKLAGARRVFTLCHGDLNASEGHTNEMIAQIRQVEEDTNRLGNEIMKQAWRLGQECGYKPEPVPDRLPFEGEPQRSVWQWPAGLACKDELGRVERATGECRTNDEKAKKGIPVLEKELAALQRDNVFYVGQLEGLINAARKCCQSVAMRTPKNILLFANDNPDVSLQPQRFFDKPYKVVNPDLDDWIAYLNRPENLNRRIRIHGYANDTGKEERNEELSNGRARSVENYLTKQGVGSQVGPTFVPAEDMPAAQRTGCIKGTAAGGALRGYCAATIEPGRIAESEGYGSNPAKLKELQRKLAELGVVVTEADTHNPIYRMVWLEISDANGNFKD